MKWSPYEEQVLRDKFETASWTELKGLLRNHTREAIWRKAIMMGLNRARFSTAKGGIFQYALCHKHGRLLRTEINWKGKIACCPRCGRRLREIPRKSKFKAEIRDELRT